MTGIVYFMSLSCGTSKSIVFVTKLLYLHSCNGIIVIQDQVKSREELN